MPWSKLYVKSTIRKMKELYVATITWSWYNIQNWTELEIFDTIEQAREWILRERTNGSLTYELT